MHWSCLFNYILNGLIQK